ncbi:MAG: hypothetical protein D6704_13740 [Nitrospirae bacterium]|nr:MAG: hypothetical protein D6704_13740 [Nitrospirota bacterium]
MPTKLTLRMDEGLIKKAKAWAKARHISLSHAGAEFLAQLPAEGPPSRFNPWTRRLAGVALGKEKAPTDDEACQAYLDYLQTKHR